MSGAPLGLAAGAGATSVAPTAPAAPMASTVPTVSGPALSVAGGALVDGHAHCWIDPPTGVAREHALQLADEGFQAAAVGALARAANKWARDQADRATPGAVVHSERQNAPDDDHAWAPWRVGVIDCQPPFAGRDARRLAAISRRSGVAVACVTGFHLARYYAAGARPWTTVAAAADCFESELTEGLAEAPGVRAVAIKAALDGAVADDPLAWEAAVEAQRRTGACLLVHTERGAGVAELVERLTDMAVPADRVYLCHLDKRPDLALHAELARAGVLLGYDTFLRPRYQPDLHVWPLLHGMADLGLAGSVAVCLDLATPDLWRAPNPGPRGFIETVARRLAVELPDDAVLDGLLGRNVLRTLARTHRDGGSS